MFVPLPPLLTEYKAITGDNYTKMTSEPKANALFIIILGMLSMLTPFAIDMYLSSFLTIAQELNVSEERVQSTLALFTLGFAFGQLIWGPLSDSYGRKRVIIIGVVISALISLLITQVTRIEHFHILRFFQGLFGASPSVVVGALLRDLFTKNEFARKMSMIMIVTMIAPLIAPIVGGYIAEWWHWRGIFYILSAFGILAAVLVMRHIPETLPVAHRQKLNLPHILRTYRSILSSKLVLGYIFCNSLSYAGMFCFLSSGSLVYTKIFGVEPKNFGYFFVLNVIVMMTATSLNGKFVTRIGTERSLRIGLSIQLLAGILLLISGYFHLGLWVTALGIAMFVGLVSVVSSNANAAILELYPEVAGTANSLTGMLRFGIGSVVGAILALFPIESERPMTYTIFTCIAVGVISYLLLVQTQLRKKPALEA